MIVEFIGSTGAGKTTLFGQVKSRLAKTTSVAEPFDVISDLIGLPKMTNATLQNLLGDAVGFNFLVRSIQRHTAFLGFALDVLQKHSRLSLLTLNSLRSIMRSVGVHELLRRRENGAIVLVDEGTVLAAHNLFIYTDTDFGPEQIARFATLAPLPDKIICVKAPLDHLVRRSLERRDPPREMRSKDPKLVQRYVERASKLFEQLVDTAEIYNRALVVENGANGCEDRAALADRIARFILDSRAEDFSDPSCRSKTKGKPC